MNQNEDKLGNLIQLGVQLLSDSLGYEIPLNQVSVETVLLGKDELDFSIIHIENQRSLPDWVVGHMYFSQGITAYVLTSLHQDDVIATGILPKE